MNILQKMMTDLREKMQDNPAAQRMLALLEEKSRELGDNPTDEEATAAFKACLDQMRTSEDGGAQAVDSAYMEQAVTAVREVLQEDDWHFREELMRPDLYRFEMGVNLANLKSLKIRVFIEDNPKACQIIASFPFVADTMMDYPLCRYIASFNFTKRFGALNYDERDGELTCNFSYPIDDGINKPQFLRLLRIVLSLADDAAADLRKYATGRFKSKEVTDILTRVNKLVSELTE